MSAVNDVLPIALYKKLQKQTMDELSLKLETIIKRFSDGEIKGNFFYSDTDSQTLLTVAKQLNVNRYIFFPPLC